MLTKLFSQLVVLSSRSCYVIQIYYKQCYLQALLRRNQHQHPLIFMRGMKSSELVMLLDFMYYGEIEIGQVQKVRFQISIFSILQEDLPEFLAVAEELKLKGLTPEKNGNVDHTSDFQSPEITPKKRKISQKPKVTPEHFVCEVESSFSLSSTMEEEPPVFQPHCGAGEEGAEAGDTYPPELGDTYPPELVLDQSFDPEVATETVRLLEERIQSMITRWILDPEYDLITNLTFFPGERKVRGCAKCVEKLSQGARPRVT